MAEQSEQAEKPKKVVFDDDVKADDFPDDPFSGIKKKKKSKKSSALSQLDELDKEVEGDGEAPEEGEKKEKKKKKKFDLDAFDKELAEGEDNETTTKPAEAEAEADEDKNEAEAVELGGEGKTKSEIAADKEDWLNSDRDYTYHELLGRLYKKLYAKQPNLLAGGRKKYTLAPPLVQREGKKSVFVNIEEIYRKMHRERDHLVQFLLVEMGTTGSVDGAGRLIIKGRFQAKQIEGLLKRYVVEYVTCVNCKSPNTTLVKDNRMNFLKCNNCGSQPSVAAIKSGFQAQIGRRKNMA